MRIAILKNGVVQNVCEAGAEWVAQHGGIETDTAGIGWTYDGTTFSEPIPTAEELAAQALQVADNASLTQAKADVTVRYLITHTPQECYDKVMADVTNLAQAKEMMGRMAMALSAIARKQLR